MSKDNKVFVIGIDGMDPKMTRRMVNEGKLPNIKQPVIFGPIGATPLTTCKFSLEWVGGQLPPGQVHTSVIGIDGMDPKMTRRMVNEGKLPNIKKMIEMGSAREDLVLLGAMPTITPPMWTTLATGRQFQSQILYCPCSYYPTSHSAKNIPIIFLCNGHCIFYGFIICIKFSFWKFYFIHEFTGNKI